MGSDPAKMSFFSKLAMSVAAGLVIVLMILKALDQQPIYVKDTMSADRYYPSYREMVPAMPKDVSKYKTQMCRNYIANDPNSCKFGVRCIFAHSVSELRTLPKHEDARNTMRELRVAPRLRQPARTVPRLDELFDTSTGRCSPVAAGPDGSGGFAKSHAIGRLTLMRLNALQSQAVDAQ